MSTIALDLDGTLVEKAWPSIGPWLPGAIEAVKEMQAAGHTVLIYTARTNAYRPDGSLAPPSEVLDQICAVRNLLDDAGLTDVAVWDGHGKPFYHVLVDDRAMRFPGRRGSWGVIVPAVMARAK